MSAQVLDHDVGTILSVLRRIYGVDNDKDVFVIAFENQGMNDACNEYRIFVAAGGLFLPACVQCEYLQRLRTVPP